ncbi:unnamed protein product [Triticum turgidum subsp. durum]|uniref:Glycerol-3-phosphate acyltransferase RAM2/GPAT1-8 HAD-like domain-containing protein n=1 Tax=Triticum turgidum subsp. durum TaxID=4567 RepID=A0A9R1R3R6_TRITD|nr:unnamed protein product [Triticum turgidum subsp. durum]
MVKKPYPFHKPFSPLRRLLRRTLSGRHHRRSTAKGAAVPPTEKLQGQTVIVDVEAWLLMSRLSTFPYFMLVAVEAGGFLRGLLLLLTYPLMCLFGHDMRLRAMVMVSFFGLREKEVLRVSKAVLPKLFLEDVASQGLEAVKKARTVVAVSTVFPRVMVEGFLKEYLGVDTVVGREVMVVAGRYIGVITDDAVAAEEIMNKGKHDEGVGLVKVGGKMHHLFSHNCKETYAVSEADKAAWQALPRDKYPKPLVFHDGRLAFTPTFSAAIAMYTYIPFGIFLAILRSTAYSLLPYRVSVPIGALTRSPSRLGSGSPSPRSPTAPLFAELAAEVTPVALETRVDMFYGTSTKPASKVLDPLYFMMNPRPEYRVEFLDPVDTTTVADGDEDGHGHDKSHSIHVANRVQRVLGEALAFELTEQTRKDKYMMLAGNEGIVKVKAKK